MNFDDAIVILRNVSAVHGGAARTMWWHATSTIPPGGVCTESIRIPPREEVLTCSTTDGFNRFQISIVLPFCRLVPHRVSGFCFQ
jgi:hypothetical protein